MKRWMPTADIIILAVVPPLQEREDDRHLPPAFMPKFGGGAVIIFSLMDSSYQELSCGWY